MEILKICFRNISVIYDTLQFFFTERGISNGQSNESISSMDEGPIPPPRKVSTYRVMQKY